MIIISATLDFETEADRDKAVSLTKDIQMATRTEERLYQLLFCCRSSCS